MRFDPPLARETYLEAVQAAGFARILASGETVGSIARAALAEAPLVEPARPVDLLLDAISRFRVGAARAYLMRGAEIPFGPEHIIDIVDPPEDLVDDVRSTKPSRRWPRDCRSPVPKRP
jgi:hypothetical protein